MSFHVRLTSVPCLRSHLGEVTDANHFPQGPFHRIFPTLAPGSRNDRLALNANDFVHLSARHADASTTAH